MKTGMELVLLLSDEIKIKIAFYEEKPEIPLTVAE